MGYKIRTTHFIPFGRIAQYLSVAVIFLYMKGLLEAYSVALKLNGSIFQALEEITYFSQSSF